MIWCEFEFGAVLRAVREGRRLSQYKLAELLDTEVSYINRLESGKRMPSRQWVRRAEVELTSDESALLYAAAGFVPLHDANLTRLVVQELASRCG